MLGRERASARLGSVRLHGHQCQAVIRIHRALREFGGVLLADSVGLGKTYVALAAARGSGRVLVVAPAILRSTWVESSNRAAVEISFVSMESLSRVSSGVSTAQLVIVDEAHHFRNPGTRRYSRLAELTAAARIVLLTATPVHNRPADLSALLALFLGSAADSLTPHELARCVIRREHRDTRLVLPTLRRLQRVEIEGSDAVARAVLELPPPLSPRDGSEASRLVRVGLLHLWTSSDAAAVRGIRRRLAAGAAIRACLLAGHTPSRSELRCWLAGDATVQLGFPELLIEPIRASDPTALSALDAHVAALERLLQLIRAGESRDVRRASALRRLCSTHQSERMLAFASYAATVHSLFEELVPEGEVAAATAHGGRIASGGVSREEVLRMFRAPKHRRERLRLLLATDLLSEGLNLPEASVVVHLDLPWTAARLEQRLGRARRPGNSSREVTCYAFTQPAEIERLIGKEQLIARKARAAEDLVGQLALGDANTARKMSPPRAMESARQILSQWERSARLPAHDGRIRVAAARASRAGFLALIRTRQGGVLLAGPIGGVEHGAAVPLSDRVGMVSATTDPNVIHATLAMAGGAKSPVMTRSYLAVRRTIARWLADESVRRATSAPSILPRELRALIQRLDAAVASAPLHLRSGVAVRVGRIREALLRNLPRGLEINLAARARSIADDMQLITALQTLIVNAPGTPPPAEDELAVVLILESNVQRIRSATATSVDRRPYPVGTNPSRCQRSR